MFKPWQINELEHQLPLLEVLTLRIPAAPRAFLHQLCKRGRFCRGAETLTAATIMARGDQVVCSGSARLAELITASHLDPAAILYEDRNVLVIDKPSGLAVHRAKGHDNNLQGRLQQFLHCRGQKFLVAPAHRLDIGTSGPVLFGKGRRAISLLGQQLMAGEIDKSYLAMVHGSPPQEGELQTPVPMRGKLKPALTRFRLVAGNGRQSLLRLQLVTGRTHQIRRQLAAAGWPILGDHRYGAPDQEGLSRPFLHCAELSFVPPDDTLRRQVAAPLPVELQTVLERCGLASGGAVAEQEKS